MRFGSVEVIGGAYNKQNTLCQAGHRKECSISLDRAGNKVWIDVSEARLRGEDMSGERTYFVPASFFLSLV
jgi:hypothetical protein